MSELKIYAEAAPSAPLVEYRTGEEISSALAEVGVSFERWSADAEALDLSDHEAILAAYSDEIERLKARDGYQTVDVVSMHPAHPDRAALREKFLFEHRHSEDEVRFFVAGQGLFCLHIGARVYQVLCERGDLISVPQDTRHWFDMGSAPSFTAIRLFNNVEGWVAHATGSEIASSFPTLP
jgi:1,2-dihydroxy-3-keto-5-methylthiopentene dioxygenase